MSLTMFETLYHYNRSWIAPSCNRVLLGWMMLSLAVLTGFHSFFEFDPPSAPMTYCLKNSTKIGAGYTSINVLHNEVFLSHLRHCNSDYCEKLARVCSDDEQPMNSWCYYIMPFMSVLFVFNYFAVSHLKKFISEQADAKRKPD
jgi:hypothetical protein